ncbi:4-hydroxy-tetrahydrodipicolinate reductase [Desulfothermobacter acidiphilus]|uniref:4-hydroxy-tetrahydrodipicolinate reductase n=1 Tax=Desulfothermobacter acidiphilus TaxID=1938353 RepID=UPI003F8A9E53
MIRVVVTGAAGRMGREVVKAVSRTPGMEVVGAVDPGHPGQDVGLLAGIEALGVTVRGDLAEVLRTSKATVMVDFTTPGAAVANIKTALEYGVRPVVGTTGIAQRDVEEIKAICREKRLGGLIVPNFALGAVLMMHFAGIAARYFPDVEIIELHHPQKLDAPSGTALQTADIVARSRQEKGVGDRTEVEKLDGARGGNLEGVRIHSVRLPGLVAHQEVIFGGLGQTLTIRHDSTSRESFMPGVIMAIKKVMELEQLVYGLDRLIFG